MWAIGFTRNCEDILRHIEFKSSNPAAVCFVDFINYPISFSLTWARCMDSVKQLPKELRKLSFTRGIDLTMLQCWPIIDE